MLSDGDVIAVLHMNDGMVCRHPINKQSWSFCILCWQRQFNKVDRMPDAYLHNLFQTNNCFVLDLE